MDSGEVEDTRLTVWAMGFGRSGTHWLGWLLGDALNSPVAGWNDSTKHWAPDGGNRPGPYIVRHVTIEPKGEGPLILIVRDPRDVMVSQMKYWHHPFEQRWIKVRNWTKYYTRWLTQSVAIVRYEDLNRNCAKALHQLLTDSGLDFDPRRISGVCHRQRFAAKRTWKSEGRWVPNNFFWKGKIGSWREHLTDAQVELVETTHHDMMERFGYA